MKRRAPKYAGRPPKKKPALALPIVATLWLAATVGGFSTAVALARYTDLIASVPERHTGNLRAGMFSFQLPFATPAITVSMLWHPRLDADPAQRWLRALVREVCAPSP